MLGFCDLIVIHCSFPGSLCVLVWPLHLPRRVTLSSASCSSTDMSVLNSVFCVSYWCCLVFYAARQSVGHRSLLALTLLGRLREYIRDSSLCNSFGPSLSLNKVNYFIYWLYLFFSLLLQSVSHKSLPALVLFGRLREYILDSGFCNSLINSLSYRCLFCLC